MDGKKEDESPKRDAFTLEYKFEILKFVDDNPDHTKKDITKHFGLKNSSTLLTIIGQREKIIESYEKYHNTAQKKIRRGNYWDLEESLCDWLNSDDVKDLNTNDNSVICDKANELASELSYSNFRATPGWVDRFRNRHGLMLDPGDEIDDTVSVSSDTDSTDEEDMEECRNLDLSSYEHWSEAAAPLSDIIEKAILNWIKARPVFDKFEKDSKHYVSTTWTGPICHEVNRILSKFGVQFECSFGWVDKFLERNGLKWCELLATVSKVKPKIYTGGEWANECLLAPLSIGAKPRDIFCVTETSLLFRTLPEMNMLQSKMVTTCPNGEHAMERVSVLVSTNMDGSEKEPLVVVGKFPSPHCLTGIRYLPLTYESDAKAWITTKIFASWLQRFDHKMHIQERKVVLLLKLSPVHQGPKIKEVLMNLKAVTMLFLPHTSKDCTHKMNPMDLGIVQALKEGYRKFQLWKVLISSPADKPLPTLTLRDAINFLDVAWREVRPQVIWSSFRKCGLLTLKGDAPVLEKALEAENALRDTIELQSIYRAYRDRVGISAIITQDKFTSFDNHILVCDPEETTTGKTNSTTELDDDKEPVNSNSNRDPDSSPMPIEPWEASECLDKLRHFVRCARNPPENILARTKPIEDFIFQQGLQAIELRQTNTRHTSASGKQHEDLKQGTSLKQPAYPKLHDILNGEITNQHHVWTDGPQIVQIDSLTDQANKKSGNISAGPCIVQIKSLANQSSKGEECCDNSQNPKEDKVTVRNSEISKPTDADHLGHRSASPTTTASSCAPHLATALESLSAEPRAGKGKYSSATLKDEGPIIVSGASLSGGRLHVTQDSKLVTASSALKVAATLATAAGHSQQPQSEHGPSVRNNPRMIAKPPTAPVDQSQSQICTQVATPPKPSHDFGTVQAMIDQKRDKETVSDPCEYQKNLQNEVDATVAEIYKKVSDNDPETTTDSSSTLPACIKDFTDDSYSARKKGFIKKKNQKPAIRKTPTVRETLDWLHAKKRTSLNITNMPVNHEPKGTGDRTEDVLNTDDMEGLTHQQKQRKRFQSMLSTLHVYNKGQSQPSDISTSGLIPTSVASKTRPAQNRITVRSSSRDSAQSINSTLSDEEWEEIFQSAIDNTGGYTDDDPGNWVFQWFIDAVAEDGPDIPHTDTNTTTIKTENELETVSTGLGTVTSCDVLVENPLDGHSSVIKQDVEANDSATAMKEEVDYMEEDSSATICNEDNKDHLKYEIKQEENGCREAAFLECDETAESTSDDVDDGISGNNFKTDGETLQMPDSPEPSWFSSALGKIENESNIDSPISIVKDEVDTKSTDIDLQKQKQEMSYQAEQTRVSQSPDMKQEVVADQGTWTTLASETMKQESRVTPESNSETIVTEHSLNETLRPVKSEGVSEEIGRLTPPPVDFRTRGLEEIDAGSDTDDTVLDFGTEDDQHKYPVIQVSSEGPVTLINSIDTGKGNGKDNNNTATSSQARKQRKRKRIWTKRKGKAKRRKQKISTEGPSHESE